MSPSLCKIPKILRSIAESPLRMTNQVSNSCRELLAAFSRAVGMKAPAAYCATNRNMSLLRF